MKWAWSFRTKPRLEARPWRLLVLWRAIYSLTAKLKGSSSICGRTGIACAQDHHFARGGGAAGSRTNSFGRMIVAAGRAAIVAYRPTMKLHHHPSGTTAIPTIGVIGRPPRWLSLHRFDAAHAARVRAC